LSKGEIQDIAVFIKPPFKAPPGAEETFEVRYSKGRKPFATRKDADQFAKDQRALADGWAEVSQVIKIVVDRKS
jgi:hypothetical protein